MKVLVTGANGYLGQGIVKQLLNDGVEVVAADFSSENIDKRAVIKKCDLFNIDNPFDYFERPDVVLHLAWRNGFVHNSPTHIEDLNNHCTFIKKIIDSGIKRVAVMGTMHEIGFFEGSIDENTPCNPQSLYGIAKNALRNVVFLLCKNANITVQWLRGFYIVGNSFFGNSIFSKITAAEKEKKKTFPFTNGLNQYDFIDYSDFCLQVASTVEQQKVLGIINICSGMPVKLADRVERFIKENNYKIKLEYGAFPDREYDSKAVWGNNSKIKTILDNRGGL